MSDREWLTPQDEADWLAMRRQDVTSTQVSALFGLSPYMTLFELYHLHASGIELPFEETARMAVGKRMEAFAAEDAANARGWVSKPLKDYCRLTSARMGSSFDWLAYAPEGLTLIEVKAVDPWRHRDLWVDDQAPEHIELQVQHQMHVSGIKRALIVVHTSIYDRHEYEREYDPEVGAALEKRVRKFWRMVDAREEPDPDYARDEDVIKALYPNSDGEPMDATSDLDFAAAVARFERAKAVEKEAKEEKEAARAEIWDRMETAPLAFTDDHRVSAKWTKGSEGRVITEADVGTVINARQPFRRLDVKNLKPKGDDE